MEDERDVESLNDYGVSLCQENRYEEAICVFDSALRKAPDCVPTIYNKGAALLEVRRTAEALQTFKGILSIDAEYADAYFGIGNCYFDDSEYAKAVKYYDEAIEKSGALSGDWRKGDYWYNKGKALERMGYDADAERCFAIAKQY